MADGATAATFAALSTWLPEHWVDLLSAIGAVFYAWYMRSQSDARPAVLSRATGFDYFNGLALAPLLLLFAAAFSSTVLTALMESSRLTMAGASVLATLAILEEKPSG